MIRYDRHKTIRESFSGDAEQLCFSSNIYEPFLVAEGHKAFFSGNSLRLTISQSDSSPFLPFPSLLPFSPSHQSNFLFFPKNIRQIKLDLQETSMETFCGCPTTITIKTKRSINNQTNK